MNYVFFKYCSFFWINFEKKNNNYYYDKGSSRITVYPDQRNSKFIYSESPNKYITSENAFKNRKIYNMEFGIIEEEKDNVINSNLLARGRTNTKGFLPNDYFPKNSAFLGKKSNQLIIFWELFLSLILSLEKLTLLIYYYMLLELLWFIICLILIGD